VLGADLALGLEHTAELLESPPRLLDLLIAAGDLHRVAAGDDADAERLAEELQVLVAGPEEPDGLVGAVESDRRFHRSSPFGWGKGPKGRKGPKGPPYPPRTKQNQQYATGAANRIESTTSRTPPNPGTVCEASFCLLSRLMSDSARSPRTPAIPTVSPKPRTGQGETASTGDGAR